MFNRDISKQTCAGLSVSLYSFEKFKKEVDLDVSKICSCIYIDVFSNLTVVSVSYLV